MALQIYNTTSRKKELFTPLKAGSVGMYNCGPTVYKSAHIGNLRAYVVADILRRTFIFEGLAVKQVINITDVGHLVSDADDGEDKLETAVRAEGKTAQEIAAHYTQEFFDNLTLLNIQKDEIEFPKATDNIDEQIAMIQALEEKDYTYQTSDGVYFDTSKSENYGALAKLDIEGLQEGARVEKNEEKKNITDFALWKFSPKGEQRDQEWESPWGTGFPGWHIECSAMSQKYLGDTFDIHTGGIDHIPVHHTNEIAQSEAVTGQPLANYWLHVEFVNIAGEKMAKSDDNFITLQTIEEKGFSPLAYRYWLMTAHYRTMVQFSWEALEAASHAYEKLVRHMEEYAPLSGGAVDAESLDKFTQYIEDDLSTPQAIALLWDVVKSDEIADADKKATILKMDEVFGLVLSDVKVEVIPEDILALVKERDQARSEKDWTRSDELRNELKEKGFEVLDTEDGSHVRKI